MALKELESPFCGLEKAAVQEWFVSPVTQRILELNAKTIYSAKAMIVDSVVHGDTEAQLKGVRELQTAMAIEGLIAEAKIYAK